MVFIKRFINSFVKLTRIGELVDEGYISSTMGRAIEGIVYSFEFSFVSLVWTTIQTQQFSGFLPAFYILLSGLFKTAVECYLKNKRSE